jgi:hypothetical protein
MANCSYSAMGQLPGDMQHPTAFRSKRIVACSLTANTLEANDVTVNNLLDVNGDLEVDNLTVNNNASIGGDLTVAGTSTFEDIIVNNNASIGGDITVNNNITVLGDGTFENITVNNDGSFGNNVTVGNDLTVTGDGSFTNVTASDTVTSTDYTVSPTGFPDYDLIRVSGAIRNVLAYGVDNSGATDVTSAVNTILAGGGQVFFPRGTYRFNSGLSLPNNTSIIGEHYGSTFFDFWDDTPGATFITMAENDTQVKDIYVKYLGAATDAIAFSVPETGVQYRVKIENVETDTNGLSTVLFAHFLVMNSALIDGAVMENCWIQTSDTSVIINSSALTIVDNFFINKIADVISVQTNGTSTAIISNNGFEVFTPTTTLFEINSNRTYIVSNDYRGTITTRYGGTSVAQAVILDNGFLQVPTATWTNIPGPYADDATAGGAGLTTGQMYYTATGGLQVKL